MKGRFAGVTNLRFFTLYNILDYLDNVRCVYSNRNPHQMTTLIGDTITQAG